MSTDGPRRGLTIAESRPIFARATQLGWDTSKSKAMISTHIDDIKFGRSDYGLGVGEQNVTQMEYSPELS